MDISQNVYSISTHLYEKNIYNDIINEMDDNERPTSSISLVIRVI